MRDRIKAILTTHNACYTFRSNYDCCSAAITLATETHNKGTTQILVFAVYYTQTHARTLTHTHTNLAMNVRRIRVNGHRQRIATCIYIRFIRSARNLIHTHTHTRTHDLLLWAHSHTSAQIIIKYRKKHFTAKINGKNTRKKQHEIHTHTNRAIMRRGWGAHYKHTNTDASHWKHTRRQNERKICGS